MPDQRALDHWAPDLQTSDPIALLSGAVEARTRPVESAVAIAQALEAAPQDLDIRLAAYRFYFYNHDHKAALAQAEVILALSAQRLNLPQDWRLVQPGERDFTTPAFATGLYLQALIAIGYCAARTGAADLAHAALTQARSLDPSDRFGGAWLLGLIEARDDAEDD
ncbi:MAG: hypothetical protein AAFU80_06495 [Pseudomonadota bacterium]